MFDTSNTFYLYAMAYLTFSIILNITLVEKAENGIFATKSLLTLYKYDYLNDGQKEFIKRFGIPVTCSNTTNIITVAIVSKLEPRTTTAQYLGSIPVSTSIKHVLFMAFSACIEFRVLIILPIPSTSKPRQTQTFSEWKVHLENFHIPVRFLHVVQVMAWCKCNLAMQIYPSAHIRHR